MAAVPHLAYPFEITSSGRARLVEQDSIDEITQNVYGILATHLGEWIDDPSFGLAEQIHRKGGASLDEIRAAVLEWEPRAEVLTDHQLEGVVDKVRMAIDG